MHRHRCDIPDGFHIPDLPEQFFLGVYMVRMTRKECKKIKLLGRKCLFFPIDPYASCSRIDLQTADLNDLVLFHRASSQPVISCQMCLHSCNQLTRAERLGHIIIRTKTQATNLINIILLCRYHDDRCILHISDLAADIKPVNPRKHQIQNKQVIFFIQRLLESCLTIIGNLNRKSA